MKGINVEVWYYTHGVDVKQNIDLYFSGMMNIEGTLKVIRDAYNNRTSQFRNFVVSINQIDSNFNLKGYSRLKMDGDGKGKFVIEYDMLEGKRCFDFKEFYADESERKSLNRLINKITEDINVIYDEHKQVV